MNGITTLLLWFTAGVAGFILGLVLARATATPSASPTAPAETPKVAAPFCYAAVTALTFGLGLCSALYVTRLLEARPRPRAVYIEAAELPTYPEPRLQVEPPLRIDPRLVPPEDPRAAQFLLLTDPPQEVNGHFIRPSRAQMQTIR